MRRTLLLFIAIIFVFGLAACNNTSIESSGGNVSNTIELVIGDKTYSAELNKTDALGDVVIYDRDYLSVEGSSVLLGEQHSTRKIFSVELNNNEFSIKKECQLSEAIIEPNGLLISFADTSVSLKEGTVLTLKNYTSLKVESFEFTTFTVGGVKRRLYLRDPEIDIQGDVIVLLTDGWGKEYTLKEDQTAFSLEKSSAVRYKISNKLEGSVPSGTFALVFSGKYNSSFAENLMKKGDTINFKNLADIESSVYEPSVKIGDNIYKLSGDINSDVSAEGIYIFDNNYSSLVTPKIDKPFKAVVFFEDNITYVAENNEQIVVPNKNGFVLFLVGEENISLVNDVDKVKPILCTPTFKEEVPKIVFEYQQKKLVVTKFNDIRETNDVVVYTQAYGEYTKTNEWGCEIAVDKNGVVVEFSTAGNMKIPDGGMVISAHGDMIDVLKEIYLYGSIAKFDSNKMNVIFEVTPTSTISSIQQAYKILESNYNYALMNYRDFDYKTFDNLLGDAKSNIEKTSSEDLSVVVDSILKANDAIISASNLYFSSPTVENRSVWYAPYEKNEDEVRKTIQLIKSLNINALYIETWRSGQTIYKTNLDMTMQESRFGGFDVLEAFVRIGHENGIEIHAWVHDFFVGTADNKNLKGHVLNLHPDWALEAKSGTVYNPTEYGQFIFLNPYKKECRDLLLSVYREILENYDVDGLHLDYIRFPEPNGGSDDWGYNDDIVAAFQKEYNTKVDPRTLSSSNSLWYSWCKFRENIITSFVGEVYDLVQEVDPEVWLSAAIYSNIDATSRTIFQNCFPWVDNGWMDEIFAMSYASSADHVLGVANNFLNKIKDKCFYSAGIGAFAGYDNIAYLEEVEFLRDTATAGTNIFSLASINGNELMLLLQETVYRNECVQMYDVENAFVEYLNSMIERCDGVYIKSDVSKEVLESLKSELTKIKSNVDEVVLNGNNRSAKKAYCEAVLPIIEAIDLSMLDSEEDFKKAIESQIDYIVNIINININVNS